MIDRIFHTSSRLRYSIYIFLTLFSTAPVQAETGQSRLFEITGSQVHAVASSALRRTYDLYIKLPPGYASESDTQKTYPVIYFNDGSYCWVTAVGVTRAPFNFGGFEKAILVGFSYSKGDSPTKSRTRDLTPTKAEGWDLETGGAENYLSFLKNEVIPYIENNYRADPNRRMLVGQSFGGLFGAYALIAEPGLFQDYVLTSPSLWFDNQVIFDMELAAADAGRQLSGRVYFAVGETETPAINGFRNDMVGLQTAFAERLRSRGHKSLIVRDEVIEGGTHLTTYPIGFTRAMRWLQPGSDIYNGGSK